MRLHRSYVFGTRDWRDVDVRVPFTEVVERRIVMSRALKEIIEERFVKRRVAHEVLLRATSYLQAEVHNQERAIAQVLSHQDATDLAIRSRLECGAKLLKRRDVHLDAHHGLAFFGSISRIIAKASLCSPSVRASTEGASSTGGSEMGRVSKAWLKGPSEAMPIR